MYRILLNILLNFVYLNKYYTEAQIGTNFVIEKFYECENHPHQVINVTIVPRTYHAGTQIVDIHLFTPIPLDNNIRLAISVESELVLGRYQHLFSFDDDFCRILEVYVGELGYEIETALGIRRKSCPIPKGHYHAMNYTIDFSRLKLQTFPVGKLRSTTQFLEKPKKNVLLCRRMTFTNSA